MLHAAAQPTPQDLPEGYVMRAAAYDRRRAGAAVQAAQEATTGVRANPGCVPAGQLLLHVLGDDLLVRLEQIQFFARWDGATYLRLREVGNACGKHAEVAVAVLPVTVVDRATAVAMRRAAR